MDQLSGNVLSLADGLLKVLQVLPGTQRRDWTHILALRLTIWVTVDKSPLCPIRRVTWAVHLLTALVDGLLHSFPLCPEAPV